MSQLKDAHILVVDDEPDLREVIRFELEMEGALVTEAGGGHEALKMVQDNNYHLVLSDIRMAEGDGIELLDNVKKLDPMKPVVMLITGYSDLSPEMAFEKGCAGFISKPFDPEELVRMISRALKSHAEQWSEKIDRISLFTDVKIEHASYAKAVEAKILNISKGGMFVAADHSHPRVGNRIKFHLNWEDEKWSPLIGEGLVRWVRKEPKDGKLPGYGIEFFNLNESTISNLNEIIDHLKNKISYIPST